MFDFISWLFFHQGFRSRSFTIDRTAGVCIHMKFVFTCNISLVWWEISCKQWISTRVNQKKIKCSRKEHVTWTCMKSTFWSMKRISENYKPKRVWLWFVYKFTNNYCRLWLFSDFIQTQKRYLTSLGKIVT